MVTLELVHDADAKPAHVAKVHGELLAELPSDLYIPPDALEILLETFEGPLDLLLYLVRKANVDILDIPMAELTRQYLTYVEAMREKNLELAAEYLVMAAMLMEIKSRMLLPRPKAVGHEEAEDPRAELVRRLLEYERMKLGAQKLDALPHRDRDFHAVGVWVEQTIAHRLPQVRPEDLAAAWRELLKQARMREHHKVTRDQLSVREHMTLVLRLLQEAEYRELRELFDPWKGVPVLVVTFLALLELAREALVEITQAEPYAPIYVKRAATPAAMMES
jgi:segregation and condensation protein A